MLIKPLYLLTHLQREQYHQQMLHILFDVCSVALAELGIIYNFFKINIPFDPSIGDVFHRLTYTMISVRKMLCYGLI